MARCCNCGVEIPAEDKTKLCDKCKKIILPFIKFMDASTSSAVRRLISNERNLRNAGATDRGMEYLLRICELHDIQKMQEKKEKEEARRREEKPVATSEANVEKEEPVLLPYMEAEIPLDEPLRLIRKPYGKFLPFVKILLFVCGLAFIGLAIAELILDKSVHFYAIVGAVASFAGVYLAHTAQKLLYDLFRIKKQFR